MNTTHILAAKQSEPMNKHSSNEAHTHTHARVHEGKPSSSCRTQLSQLPHCRGETIRSCLWEEMRVSATSWSPNKQEGPACCRMWDFLFFFPRKVWGCFTPSTHFFGLLLLWNLADLSSAPPSVAEGKWIAAEVFFFNCSTVDWQIIQASYVNLHGDSSTAHALLAPHGPCENARLPSKFSFTWNV